MRACIKVVPSALWPSMRHLQHPSKDKHTNTFRHLDSDTNIIFVRINARMYMLCTLEHDSLQSKSCGNFSIMAYWTWSIHYWRAAAIIGCGNNIFSALLRSTSGLRRSMSRKEREHGIASGQTVDLCALARHGGGRRSHELQEEAGCKSSATSQNSGHKTNAPARLKEAQDGTSLVIFYNCHVWKLAIYTQINTHSVTFSGSVARTRKKKWAKRCAISSLDAVSRGCLPLPA